MTSAETKLTAVIGAPIRHSLSPLLHNTLYAKEKIDTIMLAFENDSLEILVNVIRSLPVHLTAVTIPFKQTIIPLLDEVDAVAKKIGAVNTIINKDGVLHGHNTDFVGIAKSLEKVKLKNKNVLVIGAGGAARPVAFHLSKVGAKMYCYNRSRSNAQALCEDFNGTIIEDLTSIAFDVIINTTPIGMSPDTRISPIPASIIRPGSTVFDIIYNPLETQLLRDAKKRKAKTISGLTMFVAQAIEQERLWLNKSIKDHGYERIVKAELTKKR